MIRRLPAVCAGLILAGAGPLPLALAQDRADHIWSGGAILTMNDAAMRAEAVAEKDGKIIAVGPAAEVMKLKGPDTKLIDLAGRAMVPGFVDAHGHVVAGGIQALSANLLSPPDGNVADIPSLQQTLRDWVAANKDAVTRVNLILGFGYDHSMLKELRHPTRQDLDAISKDIPVLIVHQSGHIFTVNTKALEIAGITPDTPDPLGGVIRREADGKTPAGVLEETAGFPVLAKLLSQLGKESAPTFIAAGVDLWSRYGYTTAQEGRASPAVVNMLKAFAQTGGLKIDIAAYADVLIDREFIARNVSKAYTNRFRLAGAKLTIDGSPQGFTAWRDRPYYRPVGEYPTGYLGYAAAKNEDVIAAVDWAYANNTQILVHANGEAAIDLLISSIDAARTKHPQASAGDPRSVLIHGQFIREDQVDALKRLSIIPSLFPMHTFYWGDWHRDHTVGPMLADNISPTGWCRQRDMIFTSHHDAPVAFPDSMRVLSATVTRRTRSGDIVGPAQRVDVITALKAMTLWPAYQHFEERTKGSIEVGKLADLVILSSDPTAVDPETLDKLKVVETIKEGRSIFILTPETQRRAELMVRPTSTGVNPFEKYLIAAAVDRDMAALPPEVRLRPMARRTLEAARAASPHDKACVGRAMDDLVAAMVAPSSVPTGR